MDKDQQRQAALVENLTEISLRQTQRGSAAEIPAKFSYEIDDIERDQSEARHQLPIKNTKTPH